ncbi:hypothetical protein [Halothermothrix orenii]|uniref:hypothetical protein n=1 Tax=Halothermothrix orenii TaxID=31909 RepID=UPI00006BB041|nr:hypothetical protein [Halothermothrix orenii]
MPHKKVRRGSIPIENWIKIVFKQIDKYVIKDRNPIKGWKIRNARYYPDGYKWEDEDFIPIKEGELWGGPDTTSILTCDFKIPEHYRGKPVYFYMYTAGEVLVS